MMRIAEVLPPQHTALWNLAKQCSVNDAVGVMDFRRLSRGLCKLFRIETGFQSR